MSLSESRTLFVWGSGGVGKSHLAIRRAYEAAEKHKTLLITLDPSRRLFDLLEIKRDSAAVNIHLFEREFTLKRTDEWKIFEDLHSKAHSSTRVRNFYGLMAKGLQDFRDYLSLLDLSDELKNSDYEKIIIDTPPFQEVTGLHRSIANLKTFFNTSLVQMALGVSQVSFFQIAIKKAFEATRIFVGKRATDHVFEFIEWLSSHADRFKTSALFLEKLVSSPETSHEFILTPESSTTAFSEIRKYFGPPSHLSFAINRSAETFNLSELESEDPLYSELESFKEGEKTLLQEIRADFPKTEICRLPLLLMGRDTKAELEGFLTIHEQTA